jgi:hypothetical protein
VVPAELADPGILDRIPHRVLVKRWGLGWLTRDGAPIGNEAREIEEAQVVHVLGEHGRKIRIVVEDDQARYAAWIARDDAAETVLVPLVLADSRGAQLPISLQPGVTLDAAPKRGAFRGVAVVDPLLAVEGWARSGAIGHVWVVRAADASNVRMGPHPSNGWQPPRDLTPLLRLARGAQLRVAADPAALVIATVKADEFVVGKAGTSGAYTEVVATRPYVKVRGFIETAQVLGETEDFVLFGSGSGRGFGMSHAVKHEIPAGTCLYAQSDGEVIGVTLEADTRLGGRLGEDGWAMIYINSPWGVSSMYAKNLGRDPSQPPSWDSCTEPAHRR